MKVQLRLLTSLFEQAHRDLSRRHPFAAERVGFLTCGVAETPTRDLLLLGHRWHVVHDDDYMHDATVGACIGPPAFRRILQFAHAERVSILHVHRHEHRGVPRFSNVDAISMRDFVVGFVNACPSRPHGAVVLSNDSATGVVRFPGRSTLVQITGFEIVGVAMRSFIAT